MAIPSAFVARAVSGFVSFAVSMAVNSLFFGCPQKRPVFGLQFLLYHDLKKNARTFLKKLQFFFGRVASFKNLT
jgi:hypothetical protein